MTNIFSKKYDMTGFDDDLSMVDIGWRDIRFGKLPPLSHLIPSTNERLFSMGMLGVSSFIAANAGFEISAMSSAAMAAISAYSIPFLGRLDTLGQRMGYIGDIPLVIQRQNGFDTSNEPVNQDITKIIRAHTDNQFLTVTESRSHQFAIFKIKNGDPRPISTAKGKIAIHLGCDEDEVIFYQTYERGMSAFLVPLPETAWLPVNFSTKYFQKGVPIEYVGEDLKGQPILINRKMYPHLLYSGITNSGKSIGMLASIASMRASGLNTKVYIFDPKYDFENIPCDGYCNETVDGIEMLAQLSEQAYIRRQKYSKAGCKNYFEYVEKVDPNEPMLLAYVDELAAILEGDKELTKEAQAVISMIVRRDRAGGLMATFATQRPDASIITGEFKSNLGGVIAFAHANDVSSRVTLDSNVAGALPMFGGLAVKTAGSKKIVIGRGVLI